MYPVYTVSPGYPGSVDAAIAMNSRGNLNNFNPVCNPKIRMQYVDKHGLIKLFEEQRKPVIYDGNDNGSGKNVLFYQALVDARYCQSTATQVTEALDLANFSTRKPSIS